MDHCEKGLSIKNQPFFLLTRFGWFEYKLDLNYLKNKLIPIFTSGYLGRCPLSRRGGGRKMCFFGYGDIPIDTLREEVK